MNFGNILHLLVLLRVGLSFSGTLGTSCWSSFSLLGKQNSLDVGQHTTLSNGYSRKQFVQFFIITDGQLQVSWNDPGEQNSIQTSFQIGIEIRFYLVFLLSLAAFPANSKTSAAKYSITAAR